MVAATERDIEAMAERLAHCEQACVPGDPPSSQLPGLDEAAAYAVQQAYMRRRREHAHARLVGHKIGCTSRAMQDLFNVSTPDYGQLLDDMAVEDDGSIPIASLIQPMVEMEIAFFLRRPLTGPGVTTTDVLLATEAVAPALEVIDSRVRDWQISFVDTVADNGSSARFVIGGQLARAVDIDLRSIGGVLWRDGEVAGTGAGAASLGHPARAVAWLANSLAVYGQGLQEGHVALSGALTAAQRAAAGQCFRADFHVLGSVSCAFE
jgi:2-keto-4-pentenoate hydratase